MVKVKSRVHTIIPNSQFLAPSLLKSHQQTSLRLVQRFSLEILQLGFFFFFFLLVFEDFFKVRERMIPAEEEIPLRHT